MKPHLRLAFAILAFATLACGVIGGGGQTVVPAGPPSPTPPPVPTVPQLTPTIPLDATPTPVPTVPPDQLVQIIYGAARDGKMGLYFLSLDGRFAGKLELQSSDITHAIWPDVSPDGTRVAFVSVTSNLLSNGIYTANIDGSNVQSVTVGDGTYPHWSPDGTRLAYSCNGSTDICLIDLASQQITNLTADIPEVDTYPVWTPDGRIVFMSARGLTGTRVSEIYIMNPDGTGVTALTDDGDAYNAFPTVSPSGTQVAFESDRDVADGSEIYLMNLDGTGLVRVTNDTVWNQNPRWSPDGNVIMFASNYGDGNIDLYFINVDGSNRVRLTQAPGEDGGLRWGHTWLPQPHIPGSLQIENDPRNRPRPPRGTAAVPNFVIFAASSFNCTDCLETGLYIVGFDGANLTPLPLIGLYPTWSPDFTRIVFIQNGELVIANADGSEPTQVTFAYRGLYAPSWNEELNLIVAGCTPYGQHDVCLVDPETGTVNNITEPIISGLGIPYPSWYNDESILLGALQIDLTGKPVSSLLFGGRVSPGIRQGTTTTFRLASIIRRQLVVMNLDGTGQLQLTDDAPTKGFPVWSPDGLLIIYSVAPGDGRVYLWVADAEGVNPPRQLVARPIAAGPTSRPSVLETFLGYNWAP